MIKHDKHPETLLLIKNNSSVYQTAVHFNNFEDGDAHCLVENTRHIQGGVIVIKHHLYPNQNEQIVRLLFLAEALRDLGARSIVLFAPYLPYARQDKAHSDGEVAAARILCRTFKKSGIDALYNIDNHFMKGELMAEVEGLKIKNFLIQDHLIRHLEATVGVERYQVIGPDDGAAYLTNGQTMKKQRANTYTESMDGLISNNIATIEHDHLRITNTTVVVADDMISTGSTMLKALQNLRERGVENLYAMTSHGLFLKDSLEEISSLTKGLIYSDTVPLRGAVPVVDAIYENIMAELAQS